MNGRIGSKKRQPSGELEKPQKLAKIPNKEGHLNYDSEYEIAPSGNPLYENYDWFNNPSNGLSVNDGV